MTKKLLLTAAVAVLAASARAQSDSANEAPEPAAEKPAVEAPAKSDAPAKADAPANAEASCLVPGPGTAGQGCAGAYRVVADAYLAAYKAMDAWLSAASFEVSGAAERVNKLEQAVRDNESTMTALKLDRSKDAKNKLRELDKTNKSLWKDLRTARAAQAVVCKGFSRSAAQKVKDLGSDLNAKLMQAQKKGQ
ncbi:MAG: hypothetical protein HYZ75_15965 [Elusimicrobia bacterium]|nr:hypothetical protein [Elusimicrobiota bacterium]